MASSNPRSKNVLLAGLFHETNTFLNGTTGISDFEVLNGEEIFNAAGTGSPLAGVLDAAKSHGWKIEASLDMRAMPGPTVEDTVLRYFLEELEHAVERIDSRALDGVFLVLHGAMVAETDYDVEGTVLAHVRCLVGRDVPVWGVLDLHANFTARMARLADGLVAYRTNPHVDAYDAAVRAASLLDRVMCGGENAVTAWTRPNLLWPPTGTATSAGPMRSLEEMARQIEANDPHVLAVNVFAGFAFSDVPDAGVSFSAVTTGDPDNALGRLERLCLYAHEHRHAGNKVDLPIEQAMVRLPRVSRGPVLLVEPSDNIGAGASGRGLGVLKALLREQVPSAAVVLQGPEIVQSLWPLAPGATTNITLRDPFDSEPLELTVELVSKSDGRFELEDQQSHLVSMFGMSIDMGPCAVVRRGGVQILFTSHRTPPFDLGQLRSQGIVPEALGVIGVKAAVAHRRAYGPIARASFTVSTPGPCCSDLTQLPYKRIRRPIYPLDIAQS